MKSHEIVNSQKYTTWNTKKKEGWEAYRRKTEFNDKFMYVSEISNEKPDKVLGILEKELTRIKHASFGKVKVSKKTNDAKKLESLQSQKAKLDDSGNAAKVDEEIADTLKRIQIKEYERDLSKIDEIKSQKGKSAAIFHLKDKILGKKKVSQEQTYVIDPETGKELYSPIKEASLKYCVSRRKVCRSNS